MNPPNTWVKTLDNGLTLLGERMPGVQSVAMTLLVPAGTATDPSDAMGTATVLSDLVLRGAGDRDSRALTDHLDALGLSRSSSSGLFHTRFAAAALPGPVMQSLAAYADVVRRPRCPETGFAAARDLALQGLAGIDDEPRHKLMVKLREHHLGEPFGRNSMGNAEHLKRLDVAACRADHARRYVPGGAILAFAGHIDTAAIESAADQLFADWTGSFPTPVATAIPSKPPMHEHQESEQTHIGLAYPSIPETDPDYYVIRLAMEVLSGGMSGRLFTEIREKRALVYNVSAGYTGLRDQGHVFAYAGTSTDRAQATLDTLVDELYRLARGVTAGELDRARVGLKAATIMACESTSSIVGGIAHDWFVRGRVRSLDEIKREIDQVSLDRLNTWLAANPPGQMTLVTVGQEPLKAPTL